MSNSVETPVKKKRGRPKKVKAPEASAVDAKKVAEEVIAKANESIPLVKSIPTTYEDDISDMPKNDPGHTKKHVPQDAIPGTRMLDALHVPEFAYDDDSHVTRRVSRPAEYHYCWVEGTDVDAFKHNGYKFVLYNGGPGSGLDGMGFKGTYLYTRTLDNHVQRGDVYLMYCSMRLFEQIVRDNADMAHRLRMMGQNNFANLGYRYGIKTFTEVNRDPRAPADDETARMYN